MVIEQWYLSAKVRNFQCMPSSVLSIACKICSLVISSRSPQPTCSWTWGKRSEAGNLSKWFHAQVHNDFHNSQAQKNTHPVITSTIGPIDCKDGIGLALARYILFNWTLSEVLVELFSSAFLPVMRSEAEWSVIWQNSHLAQQSVDTIVIWQNSHLTRQSVDTIVQ